MAALPLRFRDGCGWIAPAAEGPGAAAAASRSV